MMRAWVIWDRHRVVTLFIGLLLLVSCFHSVLVVNVSDRKYEG